MNALANYPIENLLRPVSLNEILVGLDVGFKKKVNKAIKLIFEIQNDLKAKGITTEVLESLTEQEINILHSIAEGLKSTEIADKLFISTHTVQTHRKNIYKKLKCCKRTDLVKISLIL
ncbi:helix-turn-helix transcriptional regulator [Mesonia sp. K7]|uniref:helix-turn-helix domain-containing protein n=1 Tax=Mesonia sp. K7 TaxID=2218606 RepID=UPI000DAA422E|nr:helix-turn-helix transcriptional regulator [Mesonia sp. K7]PZD77025.1 hypothetical protein DNG35_10310 [Mesonia sp. K7]